MLLGIDKTPVRLFRTSHYRFPTWSHTISPLSLWALHGSWMITGALLGLTLAIKLAGFIFSNGTYPDPFVLYDTILPGQPMSALDAYPCNLSENRMNGQVVTGHFTCIIFPNDNIFDTIHVDIWNNRITEVVFYATNLPLGQVALHWRAPSSLHSSRGALAWDADNYSIEVLGKHLEYQKQIRIITVGLKRQQ